MKSEELKCMEALNDKYSGSKWWMPLVWATNIVVRARQENKIKSDPGVQTLLSELSRIRHGLTKVQHYDTLSVPLVYTQVYTNSMANLRFLGPKSWSSVVALTSFYWKVKFFLVISHFHWDFTNWQLLLKKFQFQLHSGWKWPKMSHLNFPIVRFWAYEWTFVTKVLSTQNVNVARFARNVKWDFFCDFQTPWLSVKVMNSFFFTVWTAIYERIIKEWDLMRVRCVTKSMAVEITYKDIWNPIMPTMQSIYKVRLISMLHKWYKKYKFNLRIQNQIRLFCNKVKEVPFR